MVREKGDRKVLGMAVVIMAAIICGSTGVAGEYLLNTRGLDSAWLTTFRTSLGGILMLTVLAPRYKGALLDVWKDAHSVVRLAVFGLIGIAANLYLYMLSVQAIKGVEFGDGFALADMKGTETRGRMGGLCGGVTDGDNLVLRVAMKPIPTTRKPQPTVDLATGQAAETVYERSDVCPVPRAVVILEAMACLVLADALAEKLGGDSLDEMKPRFAALPHTVRLDPRGKVFW